MKSTQNLPLRLKELRNKHNYSQEQLAEILNVSRQAVSRWENGKAVPDIDNMLFLSELYDVPLDYMLGEEYHENNVEKNPDIQKEASSMMEILILSCILLVSSRLSLIGMSVTVFILVRSIYTKKINKLMYILGALCFAINIVEIIIYFVHRNSVYGSAFIFFR